MHLEISYYCLLCNKHLHPKDDKHDFVFCLEFTASTSIRYYSSENTDKSLSFFKTSKRQEESFKLQARLIPRRVRVCSASTRARPSPHVCFVYARARSFRVPRSALTWLLARIRQREPQRNNERQHEHVGHALATRGRPAQVQRLILLLLLFCLPSASPLPSPGKKNRVNKVW